MVLVRKLKERYDLGDQGLYGGLILNIKYICIEYVFYSNSTTIQIVIAVHDKYM